VGGVEQKLYQIYARRQDLELIIYAPDHPEAQAFDAAHAWETVRIPRRMFQAYWQGRRKRAALLLELTRTIYARSITAVHAACLLPDGLLAWMLDQAWGIPYLCFFHGLDVLAPAQNPWGRTQVARVLRGASQLVGPSRYVSDQVVELGADPSKTHVVLPGVDTERFSPVTQEARGRVRKRLGLPCGRPLLLTVSRLITRKGHDKVIEALPLVLARLPGVRYVIVGSGPNEPALRRLAAEKGVADTVQFAGEVRETELPDYYRAADLFVMPNREINGDIEGFGIVFVEAAASGIPVIGGTSGGTADAVAHGTSGILVDPMDVAGIASQVLRLLADRELAARLGMAGRAMVERHYSWGQSASQVGAIVEQMRPEAPRRRFFAPLSWARAIQTAVRPD
jgi:phosphatidylinositol alpha-1,6-mannosyltransferase